MHYELLLLIVLFFVPITKLFPASFNLMKKEIIRAEGAVFTITKYDKGGATKYGVTKETWFGWCGIAELRPCDRNKNGRHDDYDIALITLDDVFTIYKKGYWDQYRCDEIQNQEVAEMLCDWVINQGLGKNRRYVKIVQGIVKMPQDGKITTGLINAINKMNPHDFLLQVAKKRLSLYDEIIRRNPSQLKFKKSWYNRTIFVLKKYEKINSLPASMPFYVVSDKEKKHINALSSGKR